LSECDAQSVGYAKRLRGNAVLYCSPAMWQRRSESPPQDMPRSDSSSLALDTRLASGLSRARQKYVFVPYRELAYVNYICCIIINLLTVDMSIGDCVVQGSPEDFRQREISMKMDICYKKSQFVSKGLVVVTEFLQDNPDSVSSCFATHGNNLNIL